MICSVAVLAAANSEPYLAVSTVANGTTKGVTAKHGVLVAMSSNKGQELHWCPSNYKSDGK